MPSLLDERHPEYERMRPLWDFTRAHYDDRHLYWSLDQQGESKYLPKKAQSEHPQEYKERKRLASYANFLGPVIDSFVGLLFHKEDEAEREWGNLGDPENENSLAALISEDADRGGTDHEAQLKTVATDLMQYQKIVTLVDTNKGREDENISVAEARARGIRPAWKRIPPQSLVNWREDEDGRVVEALIREQTDVREGLDDDPDLAEQTRFLHLRLTDEADGETGEWRRLVRDSNDDRGYRVVDENTFSYVDPHGQPDIPVFVDDLPMSRYPAHTLARLANRIFNLESGGIHWPIRKAGFETLVYSGRGFEDWKESRRQGQNTMQEQLTSQEGGKGHRYIGPSMDGPKTAAEERERLVQQFWRVAQFEFSDRAAERTATEIKADFVASMGAFLNVLAGALDEAENRVLFLLEQAAGEEPGEASVQRARNFGVEDGLALVQRLSNVFFGQDAGVPLPPELEGKITVRMMEKAGLDVTEEEVDAIMREAESRADQQRLFQDALAAEAEQTPPGGEEAEEA